MAMPPTPLPAAASPPMAPAAPGAAPGAEPTAPAGKLLAELWDNGDGTITLSMGDQEAAEPMEGEAGEGAAPPGEEEAGDTFSERGPLMAALLPLVTKALEGGASDQFASAWGDEAAPGPAPKNGTAM